MGELKKTSEFIVEQMLPEVALVMQHRLDYDRIFKTLRGVKFKGFVSLVYEGWKDFNAMHAVPKGVKFLRSYLAP